MNSHSAGPAGVQRPRVLSVPQGVTGSSGSEAVELASFSGLFLDDWQRFDLETAMSERADGSWAAAEVGLVASRQNGKNAAIEARELFGLVVLGEWVIHTSHLFTTTKESYNRLLGWVEADPDVKGTLTYSVASPASGYEMRFRGGGRIKFIARSRSSGRGLTGDLLVFDEAQNLDDDAQGALLPTISARPNAQTWYLGSAPGPMSTVFHRIRQRGRAGVDARLAYMEHSAAPDADLDDRGAWAQANPALGIRITEEAIEAERGAMSDEMFARERLSISPDPIVGGDVFTAEEWAAVVGDYAVDESRLAYGVDANPERTMAAIGVSDGTTVEVIEHRAGVVWAAERLAEIVRARPGPVAVDPAGPAGSLVPELERRGITVVPVTGRDMAQACGDFYDAVKTGSLKVRTEPMLNAAAQNATKKAAGDAFVWARKGDGNVAPLVATTIARFIAAGGGPSVYEEKPLRVF